MALEHKRKLFGKITGKERGAEGPSTPGRK